MPSRLLSDYLRNPQLAALVGNDVVTELKKNPNNTDDKWWAPKWLPKFMTIPTTPGPCQPLTIPQNNPIIRTNSSVPLFTYALLNGDYSVQGRNKVIGRNTGSERLPQALPYRSEPLQDCSVQEITAILDFPTVGFRTKAIIDNMQSPGQQLDLSVHFETDNIRTYISESPYTVLWPNDVREAHTVFSENPGRADLTTLGILDAVGSDLLKAMWVQKRAWALRTQYSEWPQQAVVKWSPRVNCTSSDKCRSMGDNVEGIEMWYSDAEGTQDYDAQYLRAMNTTLHNYMVTLRDALHLDLGTIDHDRNMFLNLDTLRSRILPDHFLTSMESQVVGTPRTASGSNTSVYTTEEFWRTCTWGWGCLNGTWSEALRSNTSTAANITTGLPLHSNSLENSYSSVIDVDFVCPTFKTKRTASLLVSVFIGTFTMYTALYGTFMFLAPVFDRKYRRKHGFQPVSSDGDAFREETRERQNIPDNYLGLRHSPASYATEFEVPKSYNTYKRIGSPSCETLPDYVFTRTSREGDELPSGACKPRVPGAYTPKHLHSAEVRQAGSHASIQMQQACTDQNSSSVAILSILPR
ncbi:hypothetical protein RSOLAG1IB_06334 [Rhizoctonia solani AG-1 IB]|uniref:Uncharacterized protein n=1 Tax=Thanatephorus cucumeris (strain AG1-IB / isolate 7/3/14) TaxID=1108050 RepID=A0A0B7FAU8_THACB|nr:hypothetical protein RSOLAG1IB_06334 [Rhizoctonia solani AG-1 IB]